jgi:hypothetical protein
MGTLIRLTAVLACSIIGIAFLTFAVDQADRGSKTQQQAVDDGDTSLPLLEPTRAPDHRSGVGGAIDRANDTLLAPFDSLIDTGNAWVDHGVPALLGLLLYGLGLGLLANFLPKARNSGGDWRTA